MANLQIIGTLVPDVSAEPTHRDIYGEGGFKSVQTIVERDAIPTPLITDGSLVYVRDTNTTYQWRDISSSWGDYLLISSNYIQESMLDDLVVSTRTIQLEAVDTGQLADGCITLPKLDSTFTDAYYTKAQANATFMSTWVGSPSADDDAGTAGTVAYDDPYFYVCLVGSFTAGTSGVWGRTTMDTTWA